MALAFAGARGQGGNALNGLHPCTLPQRATFAAVRRVSPLCAAFCPDSECVRGAAEKAHVAPTCGQREKTQAQYANPTQRSPAAAGKILPFGRSQHRIWLVAGAPAPCQMPQIGQKPIPTTSSQSPLRVYRPAGEGIPRSAPLLLSSKQNPLRWAFVW